MAGGRCGEVVQRRYPPPGRRIAVWGPSGSGKSTFARALGKRMGLPAIELDALFHCRPAWDDATDEEFRDSVSRELAAHPDGWVTDGNYVRAADLVLAEADTVIWLRLPFHVVYTRLAWRTVSRSAKNAELWGGNRETLRQTFASRDSMLLWGITSWRPHHRKIRERMAALPPGVQRVVLRSPREAREYLESAPAAGTARA